MKTTVNKYVHSEKLLAMLVLLVSSLCSARPTCSCSGHDTCSINFTALAAMDLHYVGVARPGRPDKPFAIVTTQAFPVDVGGLHARTTYSFFISSHPSSAPSIAWGPSWNASTAPFTCTTTHEPMPREVGDEAPSSTAGRETAPATGSRYVRVYRVSEYSFSVDFLSNHDAASAAAMPLYLMTCSPNGLCAPWSTADHTRRWATCQAALYSVCPGQRGAAFECMACAATHRAAVEAACGPFSQADTLEGEGSFSVHWHCGVGWPESTAEEGPITEYCVEYTPLLSVGGVGGAGPSETPSLETPSSATPSGGGFSDYLSCNSDEVDGLAANDPRDPKCICMCLDDRLLAHQTLSVLRKDCFTHGVIPWVNETVCACAGTRSELPTPPNPSLRHVGRAPIYLPYVGNELKPVAKYATSIFGGYNYHFPRGGECAEGAPLGSGGCVWRRLPRARMLYGADLLAAGWNRTFVADTPTDQRHTLANVAAFGKAVRALDALVTPIPCGPRDASR